MKVGLISCTKAKRPYRAKARDLYSASSNFRKRVAYVEESCETWFVLSAKHHLVAPDDELDPYEETLNGKPVAAKRDWSQIVLRQLRDRLGDLSACEFEIHAGRDYFDFGVAEGVREQGASVDIPAEGLGMFELGSFYARHRSEPGRMPHQAKKRESAYEPLRSRLEQISGASVDLSFSDVERILTRKLPRSARDYPAWWANDASHSHAVWLEAGWKVERANLAAERVKFRRNS